MAAARQLVTAVVLILARANNPVLEVEVLVGDTSQPLVLRDGSDPCEIIRSFCGPRDACVWQLVKHVQPLLQADWAAASARLAISDACLAGCAGNASFARGAPRGNASAELVGFLEAAIASRDAHSPFLRRYNREKAKLAPEERVAHYAAVARLLPGNAAAIDHLACALTATGQRASAARVLRRGVEVLHLWPSALQRPSTLVAGLEARPIWDDLDEFPAVRAVAGGAVLAALLPELHDVDDSAAAARFPRTLAAIRDADDGRGPSFFNAKVSILHPGSRILPHCGPSNARLRAHLAVSHGGGASIRVGDRAPVSWVPGEALVLDDPSTVIEVDVCFARPVISRRAVSAMSALSLEQEKNRMQESELIRLRTENSQLRQQLSSAQQQLQALHAVLRQQQAQMAYAAGAQAAGRPQPMPPQQPMAAAPRMMAAPPPRRSRRAARGRARAAAGGARRRRRRQRPPPAAAVGVFGATLRPRRGAAGGACGADRARGALAAPVSNPDPFGAGGLLARRPAAPGASGGGASGKKKKASKEEKKAKKEAKKQEKKKKKEAKERQRRELQARADSRNPESFSSSYSRGGMGGSTNSKWQGIGSDSVSSAGYGPSGGSGGFSSSKFDNPGKYRGFGNPAFDNNVGGGDDDEGLGARAGAAAMGIFASAKDMVGRFAGGDSNVSEIGGSHAGSGLRSYS
ncbi:peptide-aspartate beta-dioxygenase [Aureococcus anophagefferens]|nr:peptide-aspartate beta-dioxygenase [Aureococcus anophagefferens]